MSENDVHDVHDQNNILDQHQRLHIFFDIFLPLAGLSILSCLLVLCLPASSPKESVRNLNTLLSLLIFTATVLCPILSGVLAIPASPRAVFVLARGPDSLLLYSARTRSDYFWHISQSLTFNQSSLSLKNNQTGEDARTRMTSTSATSLTGTSKWGC